MKRYLLLIAISFSFTSYGQSKKDTEDWIVYYLNKYFSDCTYMGVRERSNCYFLNGKLIKYSSQYSNLADTPFVCTTKSIDLSRAYKISFNSDSVKSFNIGFYGLLQIDFDMNYMKPTIITVNNKTGQSDTVGIPIGISFMTTDQEVIKESILPRLKKAFEHLATLNGAKLLKESF